MLQKFHTIDEKIVHLNLAECLKVVPELINSVRIIGKEDIKPKIRYVVYMKDNSRYITDYNFEQISDKILFSNKFQLSLTEFGKAFLNPYKGSKKIISNNERINKNKALKNSVDDFIRETEV